MPKNPANPGKGGRTIFRTPPKRKVKHSQEDCMAKHLSDHMMQIVHPDSPASSPIPHVPLIPTLSYLPPTPQEAQEASSHTSVLTPERPTFAASVRRHASPTRDPLEWTRAPKSPDTSSKTSNGEKETQADESMLGSSDKLAKEPTVDNTQDNVAGSSDALNETRIIENAVNQIHDALNLNTRNPKDRFGQLPSTDPTNGPINETTSSQSNTASSKDAHGVKKNSKKQVTGSPVAKNLHKKGDGLSAGAHDERLRQILINSKYLSADYKPPPSRKATIHDFRNVSTRTQPSGGPLKPEVRATLAEMEVQDKELRASIKPPMNRKVEPASTKCCHAHPPSATSSAGPSKPKSSVTDHQTLEELQARLNAELEANEEAKILDEPKKPGQEELKRELDIDIESLDDDTKKILAKTFVLQDGIRQMADELKATRRENSTLRSQLKMINEGYRPERMYDIPRTIPHLMPMFEVDEGYKAFCRQLMQEGTQTPSTPQATTSRTRSPISHALWNPIANTNAINPPSVPDKQVNDLELQNNDSGGTQTAVTAKSSGSAKLDEAPVVEQSGVLDPIPELSEEEDTKQRMSLAVQQAQQNKEAAAMKAKHAESKIIQTQMENAEPRINKEKKKVEKKGGFESYNDYLKAKKLASDTANEDKPSTSYRYTMDDVSGEDLGEQKAASSLDIHLPAAVKPGESAPSALPSLITFKSLDWAKLFAAAHGGELIPRNLELAASLEQQAAYLPERSAPTAHKNDISQQTDSPTNMQPKSTPELQTPSAKGKEPAKPAEDKGSSSSDQDPDNGIYVFFPGVLDPSDLGLFEQKQDVHIPTLSVYQGTAASGHPTSSSTYGGVPTAPFIGPPRPTKPQDSLDTQAGESTPKREAESDVNPMHLSSDQLHRTDVTFYEFKRRGLAQLSLYPE